MALGDLGVGDMTLRGGILYEPSAIAPEKLTAMAVDLDKVVTSIGLGWQLDDIRMDLLYAFVFMPTLEVDESDVRQASAPLSELFSPWSHSSPESKTPSPQIEIVQLVRQAFATLSELEAPSSHCSPVSTIPSPQIANWQLLRHAFGVVSELAPPSSHASLPSRMPSPHPAGKQFILHALEIVSELEVPSSQISPLS